MKKMWVNVNIIKNVMTNINKHLLPFFINLLRLLHSLHYYTLNGKYIHGEREREREK